MTRDESAAPLHWPDGWPRRVAVTGASGFVGRHLVAALRAEGLEVVALARDSRSGPGMTQVTDYADGAALAPSFAGAAAVVHLAARAHQPDGPDADAQYRKANVDATIAVAEGCAAAGVRRLVFVSSIGVHGNHSLPGHAFTEADPPRPVEPYARSKLAAEHGVWARLGSGLTDFVIVRPPLVYGPGCPGNFALLRRLALRAPVVPLGDLDAPRRLIHVGNLVAALRVALVHPAASRRTFVLGDARDTSVAEIVRRLADAAGRSRAAVWRVPRPLLAALAACTGQRARLARLLQPLQVDPAAFTAATGWRPAIAPEHGIADAAAAGSTLDPVRKEPA